MGFSVFSLSPFIEADFGERTVEYLQKHAMGPMMLRDVDSNAGAVNVDCLWFRCEVSARQRIRLPIQAVDITSCGHWKSMAAQMVDVLVPQS